MFYEVAILTKGFSKNGSSTTTTNMVKEVQPFFAHLYGE